MSLDRVKPLDPVEPEALNMLQAVFHKLCDERSIDIRSGDAADTAAYIIHLYQRGVKSSARLMVMAGPHGGEATSSLQSAGVQRSRK